MTSQSSLNIALSNTKQPGMAGLGRRKRTTVLLPCPGSYAGQGCEFGNRVWSCGDCKNSWMYGYDDFMYCSCGRAKVATMRFKCNSTQHGTGFKTFLQSDMKDLLGRMKTVREINILILGETGAGKSTWINSIANYLTFASFEEAKLGNPVCAIPFMLRQRTKTYEAKEYFVKADVVEEDDQVEPDKNNQHIPGESVTQYPVSYVFKHGDVSIRLIDTPGFSDTRGPAMDRHNLQNVLDYLSHFDELHSICVLLKPDLTKLNAWFEFCVRQLFAHLHREARNNVAFCFTHTRGHDYGPGNDAIPVLKELLAKIGEVEVKLTRDVLYYVDNEAVLYLYSKKYGPAVEEKRDLSDTKKRSWDASVEDTARLLQHFMTIKPHKMQATVTLNGFRGLVLALYKGPLIDIIATIQANLRLLQKKRAELETGVTTEEELEKKRRIAYKNCRLIPLEKPRLMCASDRCSKLVRIAPTPGRTVRYDYLNVCCESCKAPSVRFCACINFFSGKCKRCGCHADCHRFMSHDIEQFENDGNDEELRRKLARVTTLKDKKQTVVDDIEQRLAEHHEEQKYIIQVAAKLTFFLEAHSITKYSDVLAEYLQQAIEQEADRKVLLEELKSVYESTLQSLRSQGTGRSMTVGEIDELVKTLYQLKNYGEKLKKALDVDKATSSAVVQRGDKVYVPDILKVKPGNRNKLQKLLTDN